MNISSVIINVGDSRKREALLEALNAHEKCEVITHDEGRIIVVISAENLDNELAVFKQLEKLDGVDSVVMAYSYQEDLEESLEKLAASNGISEVLTREDIDAKDIVYSGHVGDRTK